MSTSSKIIREHESYGEWSAPDFNSGNVVSTATVKREGVRLPTADEIKKIEEDAYKEGYERGNKEGYNDGVAKGEKEWTENANLLAAVISRLDSMEELREKNIIDEILSTIVAVTKQIIRRELTTQGEQIVSLINECISMLPSLNNKIIIRLNPDDLGFLEEKSVIDMDRNLVLLKKDTSVSHGGCIVESDDEKIDATIESRVAKMAATILGGQRDKDNR